MIVNVLILAYRSGGTQRTDSDDLGVHKEISKEYKFVELPVQKQVDGVRKRYFQMDIMQIA